jgi:HEPN domain-containing protein
LLINGQFFQTLDIVELGCIEIEKLRDKGKAADLINNINQRFRQNGVGFQFENGQIIKIDDQFVHAEIVKPAIGLLTSDPVFATANTEFMTAHSHYRAGENRAAIVAANNAFESTLKAICSKRNWTYPKGARAGDLVKLVRQKGLFPDYLDNTFDSYIAMMKSGLPGVRNEAGGHGDRPDAPKVPDYIAAYAIHLSAAAIVAAIEANRA